MVKNKKAMIGISFCVGAVMLVSTALADIASKSGYDQLKDAMESTADGCAGKLQNFSLEYTLTLKDGDKTITSTDSTQKVDNINKRTENQSDTFYSNGDKETSYSYRDSQCIISKGPNSDSYFVTEFSKERDFKAMENPFEEEHAKDVERVIDALVGNLKDYVVVEDQTNGSKEFSGSLSEAQIPSLVNAISSLAFKQHVSPAGRSKEISSGRLDIPEISEDIFIKKVTGKTLVNKDGIIENILGSGILSGKDKQGNAHDLTLEVLMKITDMNTTSVSKPNLDNKQVEKHVESVRSDKTIPKEYIGKYTNDIVIQKDDRFVKIGERFVEITQIDNNHITGHYSEQYNKEYAGENTTINDFNFDGEIRDGYNAEIQFVNAAGKTIKGNIGVGGSAGQLYFYVNSTLLSNFSEFDSNFRRVFE